MMMILHVLALRMAIAFDFILEEFAPQNRSDRLIEVIFAKLAAVRHRVRRSRAAFLNFVASAV